MLISAKFYCVIQLHNFYLSEFLIFCAYLHFSSGFFYPVMNPFSFLLSVLFISSTFWVKTIFSLHLFNVILYRVTFCQLSIVLWSPALYQYFSLLMLAHFRGYHCLRAVHIAKQSILKYSPVLFFIVLQVSFSRWYIYLSPLKNTTQKIQHLYNKFI